MSVLATSLLGGCSASKRIAAGATDIQLQARDLVEYGQQIGDPVVVSGAERIYVLAQNIHRQLPSVQDRVPAWLITVGWVALAVMALAVVVILWQTGIGQGIRVAVGWLPRRKVQDARLAADMLEPSHKETAREYIAARRAADPEFNSAFEKAWAARKDEAHAG